MNNLIKIFVFYLSLFLVGCSMDDNRLEDKVLEDLQALTTIKLTDIQIEESGKQLFSEERSCRKIIAEIESNYQTAANVGGKKIYFGFQCFTNDVFVTISEAVAIPEPQTDSYITVIIPDNKSIE